MDREKRQHRRFSMSAGKLVGRLGAVHTADVIDISVGGAALKADRRFAVGSEFGVKIEAPEGDMHVQGVIIRSHMLGVWRNLRGEQVPIYASAVKFREGSEERIADFLCGVILA
jgi:hypothetical protein